MSASQRGGTILDPPLPVEVDEIGDPDYIQDVDVSEAGFEMLELGPGEFDVLMGPMDEWRVDKQIEVDEVDEVDGVDEMEDEDKDEHDVDEVNEAEAEEELEEDDLEGDDQDEEEEIAY